MRYGGGASRTDRVTFNDFPASVTSLAYNDAYYEVSDVGDSTAWESIFEEIANSILTSAPQYPTETPEGADGTGGEKGTLVFTDKLGAYMKVTGTPRLVFANQQFEGKTTDGGKTYIFEGSIDANEIYPGAASLEYMTLEVSTDQNGQQTLTWTIPAALLPCVLLQRPAVPTPPELQAIQSSRIGVPTPSACSTRWTGMRPSHSIRATMTT